MGNMAVTYFDNARPARMGHKARVVVEMAFSSSYAAAGDTIPADDRAGGLRILEHAAIISDVPGDFKAELDSRDAPTKALLRVMSTGAEVAGASNNTTRKILVEYTGYK